MLHPSYSDLMRKVNEGAEGDTPVVNSRYSIVMAAAKRARQIIADENADPDDRAKPLSTAVRELDEGIISILPADSQDEDEIIRLSGDTDVIGSMAVTEEDASEETDSEEETDSQDDKDI